MLPPQTIYSTSYLTSPPEILNTVKKARFRSWPNTFQMTNHDLYPTENELANKRIPPFWSDPADNSAATAYYA